MKGLLTWSDYLSILFMLFLSWSVGIYYGCKDRVGKKRSKDAGVPEAEGSKMTRYVLGNYKMAVLPVAFSISATTLSGSAMVGTVGEVYLYGSQYVFFTIGSTIGLVLSAVAVIPVYRKMKYISIYEYLERRYDRSVRLTFSAIYIIAKMIFSSVSLYVPAICISTLTDVPQWVSIAVSGAVCICYCVTGGIKAVIWTDVIQAFFMVICNLLLIVAGVIRVGGVRKVFDVNVKCGRIGHVTYLENANTRYSIWSLVFGSIVILMNAMCAGQAGVQRILSVKGLRQAQRATFAGAALVCGFLSISVITGLVIYANVWSCDPFLRPLESGIKTSDQILVYGIAKILEQPGLKGLALAGIFSGSLSTFSSYINSFATLTVEDFIRPVLKDRHRTLSDQHNVWLCKFFTGFFGVICMFLALMVPFLGGIVQTSMQIVGGTGGPLLAVILLGMFCRQANKKGVLVGLLLGLSLCIWVVVGGLLNKRSFTTLPLYDFDCADQKELNKTLNFAMETSLQRLVNTTMPPEKQVFPLYRLSFMWFGPIGLCVTLVCGLLVSLLLRSKEDQLRNIDHRLLSSLLAHPQQDSVKSPICIDEGTNSNSTPLQPQAATKVLPSCTM